MRPSADKYINKTRIEVSWNVLCGMVFSILLFSVLFHWKTAGHDLPNYFHDLSMGCDCNLKKHGCV